MEDQAVDVVDGEVAEAAFHPLDGLDARPRDGRRGGVVGVLLAVDPADQLTQAILLAQALRELLKHAHDLELLPSRERLEVGLGLAHQGLQFGAGLHELYAISLIGNLGDQPAVSALIGQVGEECLEQPAGKELPLVPIEVDHEGFGVGEGVLGHGHHFRAGDGLDHVVSVEHVVRQPPHCHHRGAVLVRVDAGIGEGADGLVQLEGIVRSPDELVIIEDEPVLLEQGLGAESVRHGVGLAEHIDDRRVCRHELGGVSGNAAVLLPAEDVGGAVSGEGRHIKGEGRIPDKVHHLGSRRGMPRGVDGHGPRSGRQGERVVHGRVFAQPDQRGVIQTAHAAFHCEGGRGILEKAFHGDREFSCLGRGEERKQGEAAEDEAAEGSVHAPKVDIRQITERLIFAAPSTKGIGMWRSW